MFQSENIKFPRRQFGYITDQIPPEPVTQPVYRTSTQRGQSYQRQRQIAPQRFIPQDMAMRQKRTALSASRQIEQQVLPNSPFFLGALKWFFQSQNVSADMIPVYVRAMQNRLSSDKYAGVGSTEYTPTTQLVGNRIMHVELPSPLFENTVGFIKSYLKNTYVEKDPNAYARASQYYQLGAIDDMMHIKTDKLNALMPSNANQLKTLMVAPKNSSEYSAWDDLVFFTNYLVPYLIDKHWMKYDPGDGGSGSGSWLWDYAGKGLDHAEMAMPLHDDVVIRDVTLLQVSLAYGGLFNFPKWQIDQLVSLTGHKSGAEWHNQAVTLGVTIVAAIAVAIVAAAAVGALMSAAGGALGLTGGATAGTVVTTAGGGAVFLPAATATLGVNTALATGMEIASAGAQIAKIAGINSPILQVFTPTSFLEGEISKPAMKQMFIALATAVSPGQVNIPDATLTEYRNINDAVMSDPKVSAEKKKMFSEAMNKKIEEKTAKNKTTVHTVLGMLGTGLLAMLVL